MSNASEKRFLIDRARMLSGRREALGVRNHTSKLPRHSATTPTLLRNS
jgi:hypothetical protein